MRILPLLAAFLLPACGLLDDGWGGSRPVPIDDDSTTDDDDSTDEPLADSDGDHISDEDEGTGIPMARLEALYNSRKFILNAKQNPARR